MNNSANSKNKFIIKGIILVVFFLVLVIMLSFIQSIVNERSNLYDETVAELGSTWGGEQTIAGPALVVPYLEFHKTLSDYTDDKGKVRAKEFVTSQYKYAIFLPKSLNAKITAGEEIRNRGIYKATVYTADLQMSGDFDMGSVNTYFKSLGKPESIKMSINEAFIAFGLTDTSALTSVEKFYINGTELKNNLSSGTSIHNTPQFAKGISAKINTVDKTEILPFDINMVFRGSNKLTFLPLGEENNVSMASTWKNPSFEGFAAVSKTIDEKGFTADWSVSKLSRNYPQAFSESSQTKANYDYDDGRSVGVNLQETSFGVKFYDGVTHYRQVVRAVKYGYLFFALSFLVLFIFDVSSKSRSVHYIQYGVIGMSLVMFYLVLLSLSEHISFIPSYIASTIAVVVPISLYIVGFMKDKRYGVAMFGILTGLYLILLSILKMENYALIMGTALVMVVLYVLMYLTRNLRNDDKSIKE